MLDEGRSMIDVAGPEVTHARAEGRDGKYENVAVTVHDALVRHVS